MATKPAAKKTSARPAQKTARRPAKPATVVPASDVQTSGTGEAGQIEVVMVNTIPTVATLRRGGFRFGVEPYGIAISALTPEQLHAIEHDPDLITERGYIDGPQDSEASPIPDQGATAVVAGAAGSEA